MRRRLVLLTRLAFPAILVGAAAAAAPAVMQAGGGCHGDNGSVHTEGTATVIRMDVCDFAPTVSRVPVGTEVRFLNTDTITHTVIGRRLTWASDDLAPGEEFTQRFDAAGTYPYMCSYHPGMVGAIVVGDAAEAVAPSQDPVVAAAATTAGGPHGGQATALLVGSAVLILGAGLAVGLVLGRRRLSTAAGTPEAALD